MTGNILGFILAECNKIWNPRNITIFMHNLSKYDSQLFFRELVLDNGIFDPVESFISFYKTITVN